MCTNTIYTEERKERTGTALKELVPILVGAAKQQGKIEFKPDEFDAPGTLPGNFYAAATHENAGNYFTQ
jgi:hypothetical protein